MSDRNIRSTFLCVGAVLLSGLLLPTSVHAQTGRVQDNLSFSSEILGGERNSLNVKKCAKAFIKKNYPDVKVDYIDIVDCVNLSSLKRIKGKVMVALAVYIGKTRLIDNIIIRVR